MSRKPPKPLDLSRTRAQPIANRTDRCRVEEFREPAPDDASFGEVLDSLPDFLGARSLRELARAIASSHRRGAHVIAAMGGHVVKVGCGPLIVDRMERVEGKGRTRAI